MDRLADLGTSRAVVVADGAPPEPKIAIEIVKKMYDCLICSLPLKPPVFKCRAGHGACGRCAERHSRTCPWCSAGAKYKHIPWLDPYFMEAKVRCPNEQFGCQITVTYSLLEDHRLKCPHTPCYSPEPDCTFLGSQPMLCDHLKAHHDLLVTTITFNTNIDLKIDEAERRRLLATENGEHLFLLVISEGGGGGREIRAVHVRDKDVGPSWRYWCKVSTDPPIMDPESEWRSPFSHFEDRARSCPVPSEAAAMAAGGRHLFVNLLDMHPGGWFALRVRITRYQLETAAAVAPPVAAGAG